jgi:sensor histidine kinase regulating citrate/malate metabolism
MDWTKEIDFAITVCEKNGTITYMNDKAIKTFENDGGAKLIGTNVLECHTEPSRKQLTEMLEKQTKNVYTIEKNGKKKLIYQTPYYENNEYKGFVELSMEIPEVMENFVRR